MSVRGVRGWCVGVWLTGGSAAVAAMLGVPGAHAEGVDEINGWTVTPTSDTVELLTNNATLSDPGDALGLGTSPIAGEWLSEPATPLSSIGFNESFTTPDALGTTSNLLIQDLWGPGFELTSVQPGTGSAVLGFLVPVDGGHEVVDLFSIGSPEHAPPLVNPDATGPIEVGGVQLASPQDGALLNDVVGALFQGETADWSKAATLLSDLLGTDPSGAVAALADPGTLGSAGSAASDSVPPVDLNDIAISFDGLSFQTGTATATSSPGLFNLAVADGPHTFASASGLVFDLAAAVGEDSSANDAGLLFSGAAAEGTGSTANNTDLLFGVTLVQGNDSTANAVGVFDSFATVMGNDDFAAAAGPLFTGAVVKADDATAIAGPGVVDKAEALANGLTAIARGFGVTDIVPSATGSATAATDPIAAAQQTANSSADEILMQGIADLTHANQLLEQAPTASLDPRQLALLTNTEKLLTSGLIPSNNQLDPAGLPSTDQAGLTDLSQGVLHGDQSLLDAVQGFVSADRASDLTGPPILNPADLSLLAATFDAVGADYHMLGAEFGAAFFTVIGVPDIFLP